MVEPEDTGLDPEQIFNEGLEAGEQIADETLREQIYDEMVASGLDPDEVEQALYDPAPRRGRRRGGRKARRHARRAAPRRTSRRRSRVQHVRSPAYVYDPAPRGGYRMAAKRYGKKAKGLVAGLKPLVLPGATLATVYAKYVDRAEKLKASGAQLDGKPVTGVWDALMYDLKNRPTTSTMDRIKENAGAIIAPMALGAGLKYAGKKVKLHPTVNKVASMGAEGLIGVGIGNLINAILDPPNPEIQAPARRTDMQIRATVQGAQTTAADTYVPWGY